MKKRIQLISISAPSGTGKTTIVKNLLKQDTIFVISISYTTRAKRKNEIDGLDYFFISYEQFTKKIKNNDFIESAKVFDNYYGTEKKQIDQLINQKKIIIFDVDWQGARGLKRYYKDSIISIFLAPPSITILKERLIKRDTDKKEVIKKRMMLASKELKHYKEADYVVINKDLAKTLSQIGNIIQAETILTESRSKIILAKAEAKKNLLNNMIEQVENLFPNLSHQN